MLRPLIATAWLLAIGCLIFPFSAPSTAQEWRLNEQLIHRESHPVARQPNAVSPAAHQVSAPTWPTAVGLHRDDNDAADEQEGYRWTLEDLYPEEGIFGPRASSPTFSHDGRFAAYLYRPYDERRHGSDLWLYDFETDELTRVTSVSVMSEFQQSTRKVKQDRLKKHREKLKEEEKQEGDESGNEDEDEGDDEQEEQEEQDEQDQQDEERDEEKREIIDRVGENDADDEDAPRYAGISSFTWHPEDHSLLLVSQGDVYQIADVLQPELERLTNTQGGASQVDYTPTGDGFTYQQGGVVYRVLFGRHFIEQLTPELRGGRRLSSYEISPDGSRLVLVARRGGGSATNRRVDVIRFRGRFAEADSIPRTVSEDELEPQDIEVYLYNLEKAVTEEAELIRVFHTQSDRPRDIISSPDWAPDSSQVTFCYFDQDAADVQILIATFPSDDELEDLKKERDQDDDPLEHDAELAYRFQHFGGPNTPRMVNPAFAWDSHRVVFVSEQSGFRHVNLLDPLYQSVRQLTQGHYEVYPFRASDDRRLLFATATKDSPAHTNVYQIDLESGELTRLSTELGTYSDVDVSNDGQRLVGNFVRYGQLLELLRQDGDEEPELLTDSHPDKARELTELVPEFFEYKNRHGHTIHGKMFKPDDMDEDLKYPLLIYVYGGPLGTRKSVVEGSYSADGYFFQSYMAKKHDYVAVVIDPRGQSGYGGLFEKANYKQVGRPQVEDLVDGVQYLIENHQVDDSRVGIYGWSFGGFQTQMCLYTEPDVFQVGIAGAGPTEWENYNAWYTTGTVGPIRDGELEKEQYSLRPHAKNLEGQLLLIHGVEDFNVLFQDTINIYRELLQAGKETHVELFIDPTGGHGLGGDVKRLNRMRKYESFLLRTLGRGASEPDGEEDID